MTNLFLGGMPTAPDVKLLNETFLPLKSGDSISYEAIEELLGKKRTSDRFKTVVDAWRKNLIAERNIELGNVRSMGFLILNPEERVTHHIKGITAAGRKLMRHVKGVGRVDTDDKSIRARQRMVSDLGITIRETLNESIKALAADKPVARVVNQKDKSTGMEQRA